MDSSGINQKAGQLFLARQVVNKTAMVSIARDDEIRGDFRHRLQYETSLMSARMRQDQIGRASLFAKSNQVQIEWTRVR
jgi:hypothetical protein